MSSLDFSASEQKIKRLRNINYFILSAFVFLFYFIYERTLAAAWPGLSGYPLVSLCIFFEVTFVVAVRKIYMNYAKTLRYVVADEGLCHHIWNSEVFYPWKDFCRARTDTSVLMAFCSVRFQMKNGQNILLDQKIDGIGRLTHEVLLHIKDHAELENGLLERINLMRNL